MTRQSRDRLFHLMTRFAGAVSLLILAFLAAMIVWNGAGNISLEFLFSPARRFGSEGGILFQVVGSLLIVSAAAAISFPIALGTAVFKSEYLKQASLQHLSTVLIQGLNGVPSIIFGLFGWVLFVHMLGTGISWLAGSVILAAMMLPTATLAAYHAIDAVPTIYRESALALGFNRWQVVTRVLLPQSAAGAVTGLLTGLSRAVGETAPILFVATAFSGVGIPLSPGEPVSTLPTHILVLAEQATNPSALHKAWGASLVLIFLVLVFGAAAFFLRSKSQTVGTK